MRGSEADVLDRYHQAAQEHEAEIIVRLTADCPLLDPDVIDRVVRAFQESGCDYASNTLRPTYPDGLDTEVFSRAALDEAWREAKKPVEREHVTPYLRLSRSVTVTSAWRTTGTCPACAGRWTTPPTWPLSGKCTPRSPDQPDFGLGDVLELLARRPDLAERDDVAIMNEGYYHSLYAAGRGRGRAAAPAGAVAGVARPR